MREERGPKEVRLFTTDRKIHSKAFTSMLTGASFLLASVSGCIAFFRPEGRIAYWSDWHFWGMTKTEWDHLHLVSSVLFVLAAGVHLYFNWRIFYGYFYNKVRRTFGLWREALLALLITCLVAAGSVGEWLPFNLLIRSSNQLRNAWIVSTDYEPPFGHAEQISLKVFCQKQFIDLDAAIKELAKQGIFVEDPMDSLLMIARWHKSSPMALYQIIKPLEVAKRQDGSAWSEESVEQAFAGTGVGNQTVERFCLEQGLDLALARQRLLHQGLNFENGETFKQAAARQNRQAMDLLKHVLVGN